MAGIALKEDWTWSHPQAPYNLFVISNTLSVVLRGENEGRIRKLSGYERRHHLPDGHHDAAQNFVRRIGHGDVKTTAERLHADLRSLFNYKRRDFNYSCENGQAFIKTADFELEIRIDQCPEDPKNFLLITEIVHLRNESLADDPRFHQCFNAHCDRIVIVFLQAINLAEKIDAIEDIPDIADCLDYQPDASAFELKLPALDLNIYVDETRMVFQLLTLRDLGKLLEQSQRAFDILTAAGFQLRLC